jgi:polyferredoxin
MITGTDLFVGLLLSGGIVASVALASRAARVSNLRDAARVLIALAILVAGSAALFLYLSPPDPTMLWVGIPVLTAVAGVAMLVGSLVQRSESGRTGIVWPETWRSRRLFTGLVLLGLLVLDLFVAGAVEALTGSGSSIATVVASAPFLLAVSTEMALNVLLLWKRLDPAVRWMLLFQSAVVLFAPTTVPVALWRPVSLYFESVVLVGMFVYLMQYMYRNKQIHLPVSRFMAALTGVSSLTTAGLFLWVVYGTPLLFEVSILGQFLLFLDRALGPQTFDDAKRISWPLTPFWSFQLLVGIFVAELFLGALLDVQIYGSQFLAQFPFVSLSGSNGFLVGLNAIYDGLWFIAGVCVSAWFLIVMGAEMGSLVIFKIRESHEREQKVRLGLMLTVYAVAVVYIPSFWSKTPLISSPALSSIPVIGWGMGIRTGGPFAPTFFSAIILMYVSVGVLTVLFGRRALCSVMCGAAMMYQATTISAMKTYNRTSRIGRMFLGSRFSTMYTIASSLALISLLGTSFLPYLHLLPGVEFSDNDFDAQMLPFELYFGALWFLMFVSIPYIGNYNCVTTGFCHWGSFSSLFAKIGFFKLKVRDKTVCQQCTTMDCAKACPIGLVDMPQHFRTKGEFRSSKCCGVGDCVGACPYDNMYIHDIRHYIRGRMARPALPPASARLPMVKSTARPVARPLETASNAPTPP